MARITVEDCLSVVDNRFELVLMASKRARQLAKGVDPALDNSESQDKPTVLALREIAARRKLQPRRGRHGRGIQRGQRDAEPGRSVAGLVDRLVDRLVRGVRRQQHLVDRRAARERKRRVEPERLRCHDTDGTRLQHGK